jgi:sugar phosphate isomerase/epimerase
MKRSNHSGQEREVNNEVIRFAVFTKPWRTMPIPALAEFVHHLGVEGIELPVRPGFQVEPAEVARELPRAVKIFAEHGLSVFSIAGPTDEATIATCAEAGIPLIRIMVPIDTAGYRAAEDRTRRELEALVPLLDRYGITIGVQNHYGRFISNASGLRRLLEGFDPRHVAAIWDAAHNALNGEEPELALDIIWPYLRMVNLKNAYWRRVNGPEAEAAQWQVYWTSGRHGLASWPRVAAELKRRGYRGVVCLTAEYTDEGSVERLIAEDVRWARALFDQAE